MTILLLAHLTDSSEVINKPIHGMLYLDKCQVYSWKAFVQIQQLTVVGNSTIYAPLQDMPNLEVLYTSSDQTLILGDLPALRELIMRNDCDIQITGNLPNIQLVICGIEQDNVFHIYFDQLTFMTPMFDRYFSLYNPCSTIQQTLLKYGYHQNETFIQTYLVAGQCGKKCICCDSTDTVYV
jgi:hypothetical protein